jgi:hypothetical protein
MTAHEDRPDGLASRTGREYPQERMNIATLPVNIVAAAAIHKTS